jgi:hypothetical protein
VEVVQLRVRGPGFLRPARGSSRDGGGKGWAIRVAPELLKGRLVVRTGHVRCGGARASPGSGSRASSDGGSGNGDLFSNVQWRRQQRRLLLSKPGSGASPAAQTGQPRAAACFEVRPPSEPEALAASIAGLPPPLGVLTLPPGGLTSDALRAALAELDPPPRWLHVEDPVQVFGGWPHSVASAAHQALMDAVAGRWCCHKPASRGGGGDGDGGERAPASHFLRARPAWAARARRDLCTGARDGEAVAYYCSGGEPELLPT